MRANGARRWLWFCVAALLVAAASWLLFVVWHRNDLAAYGGFALPLVVLAASWVRSAWLRARSDPADDAPDDDAMERVAERLAVAVQAQWEAAAVGRGLAGPDPVEVMWDRPSLPLACPAASAAGSRRFDPLPELARVTEAQLTAARLQETYPLFKGAAGKAAASTLIAAGKIAVILDGLDEIAASLRPVALQALSQQASFRVVVLSRTAEMASAASQQGILQGAAAIELRPVSAAEAGGYLERVHLDPPPAGWGDLIDRIRTQPEGPLSSPLSLTLVRDTYQAEDDAREFVRFCDTLHGIPGDQAADQITGHLLDRVLPAAYARRPGQPPPPYDLPAARRALTRIAVCMNQDGTRDLPWWRIPAWLPRVPRAVRALRAGLVATLVFGLLGATGSTLGSGLVGGLKVGLIFGFLVGLMWLLGGDTDLGRYSDPPRRIGRLRLRKVRASRTLLGALLYVLAFVLGNWLAGGLAQLGKTGGAFAPGLGGQLGGGIAAALADDPDSTNSRSPVASWHDGPKLGLMVGLATGLMVGLSAGLVTGLSSGLRNGLESGIPAGVGIGVGIGFISCVVGLVFLAEVRMAIKWRTPIRLMRFLEDARSRNILRTVGPVYQFRHARLQDRLAGSAPAPRQSPPRPRPPSAPP